MKLELKHLAPYLPYELKILNGKEYDIVNGIDNKTVISLFRGHLENFSTIENVKPILRPLSDLTEEYSNSCNYSHKDFKWGIINKNISVLVWDSLLKNHFDVFGLIDAGLAIDINTL